MGPHRDLDGRTPLERWALASAAVRYPDATLDLDDIFLFEARRVVHKDRTVSLDGRLYEVDALLVGQRAHHLCNDVLEDLRLLTNFAMDSENRMCPILVGLTELRRRLTMAVHESLSQRLVVRHHLTGLERGEVDAYVKHRLRLAGCELPLFEEAAVEALFQGNRAPGYRCATSRREDPQPTVRRRCAPGRCYARDSAATSGETHRLLP